MIKSSSQNRFSRSLRLRLAVGIVFILAVGGLTVSLAAFSYGQNAAKNSFDRLLTGAATQIANSLSVHDGNVVVDIPVSAFELLLLAPRDRIVYGIFTDDGTLLTGYNITQPPQGTKAFYDGTFAGEPARYTRIQRHFAERSFDGSVDVVIGQTTLARREMATQITRNALIAVALIGVIMATLAVLAVQSALLPLRRLQNDFASRSSKDLTPISANVPQEIDGLVRALNRFIHRIERQLHVMQTLIADASHQLRTPIAALRAQAELAAEETDPKRQMEIVEAIHKRSLNLSRLTDQMLNHALIIHRSDSVNLQKLDVRLVATQAVAQTDRNRSEPDRSVRLELPETEVFCNADALSLIEACKNLINNAVNYGKAPITVFVQSNADGIQLGVQDAGPGIPEDLWANAGKRFTSNAGVSPTSVGLGLAIVAAVARAHRGKMQFKKISPKGFQAYLNLPPLTVGPK